MDRVDYDFALAHLGKADLDNNTIEREPRARRFTQGQKREGLLAGVRSDGRPVVGSNQGKCYIFQMGGYAAYTIKDTRSLANNPYSGSISLEVVDAAVSRRLEEILNDLTFDAEESGSLIASYQHSEVFNPGAQGWRDELVGKLVEQQQEKQASARAILDHVSSLRHQVRASLVRIDETCRDIEKAIAQEQREYDAARDVMSTEDISAHFAALARLRSRLADLREKQAQVAQTDQDIDTVKSRLTRTKDEWETMTLEQRRSFIRLITQTITLDALSDRWMKLTIEWSPVLAGGQYSEFALFLRSTGAGSNWTDEEDAILRDVYAGAARSDILVALPRRSWASCKSRAAALKITRQSREMGAFRLLENLALEDVSVMEEYGITQEQIWEGCTEWWGSGHMEGTLNSVGSPRTSINITASGQVGM